MCMLHISIGAYLYYVHSYWFQKLELRFVFLCLDTLTNIWAGKKRLLQVCKLAKGAQTFVDLEIDSSTDQILLFHFA